jgi:hypothetical protein
MKETLSRALDTYVEGDEQRQVRLEVQNDFPRFVETAREMAANPKSGVRFTRSATGREEIKVEIPGELMWIEKNVDPDTQQTSYQVTDVTATEKTRLFRAPRIRSRAHINDRFALQRAREFFHIAPIAPHAGLPAIPQPDSTAK